MTRFANILFVLLGTTLLVPDLQAQRLKKTEGYLIYHEGKNAQASPITALVSGDIRLPAQAAACASCHRESGIGTSEGYVTRSLNITAESLFAERTLPPTRPAYDIASLSRVLRTGIDVNGKALATVMPRYQISDREVNSLAEYLTSMTRSHGIGVTEDAIEIATVVAERADPHKAASLIEVIQRFVEIKNSRTRNEVRRQHAARRSPFGRNYQRAYRHWNHHVWTLKGKPGTWTRQLNTLYQNNPPFAVLSGITDGNWSTVSRFCEAQHLPCILPVDMPIVDSDIYSTLYFEGSVEHYLKLALGRLSANLEPEDILLVADARQSRLTVPDGLQVKRVKKHPSTAEWNALIRKYQPKILISLVNAAAFPTASNLDSDLRILTLESTTALKELRARPVVNHHEHVHLYPYRLPTTNGTQFPREDVWLRSQNLAPYDQITAGKALFAAHALGEALADMQTTISRPYLMETLEHSLDRTSMTSLYPYTSLGPRQRVLSRGIYLLRLNADPRGRQSYFAAEWIEP